MHAHTLTCIRETQNPHKTMEGFSPLHEDYHDIGETLRATLNVSNFSSEEKEM